MNRITTTKNKKITILATTDIHGNILGYNYDKGESFNNSGMNRIYSYIKQVKSENLNTLVVDNGDIIQGNTLTDEMYSNKKDEKHPVISAMNFMGYDAMVLGNHEFNFGLDLIKSLEKQSNFPFLSANVAYRESGEDFVKSHTIINCGGVRVGIIGLTTPNVPRWVGNLVKDLNFHDLGETAYRYVSEIRDKVDIIMVMAHASMVSEHDKKNERDAAEKILRLCPEIDVLVVGHFHITVKEKRGKTLIGGATDSGQEVIRFDLTLDNNNHVIDGQVKVVSMKAYYPSEELSELPVIKKAHETTMDFVTEVIGEATEDFQPKDEISFIPEGRLRDTPLIELINKVQLINSGADVTSTSLIRDDSNIKKGVITYGHIFNVYKFTTFLYVVEVTGKELKNYMEWAASAYNQWKSGDISISFTVDIPGYQHEFFAGVNYKVDISKPVGHRIVDLIFKGDLVKENQKLKLATSDYCYFANLKGRKLAKNNYIWKSSNTIRDMIVEYIKNQGIISPQVDNNWEITGVNLESPYKEKIIKLVNEGSIELPYNKALNIDELKKLGLIDMK
ncbi:MAG: bifunctional metallophosphatase/5'-nucleotidase [Clostridium sulfidigenes]|uniref:Bifunctional metallophosphatase/5'-nucleotidase n=1 Tax=Clostridium sulfidigenes TaxID=318464 RepID=A0A927W6Q9_9CLOT|nr:bifunctional metallophosphatase/5'-nucleotidase [Clostridium sulfidigenes]